MPQKQHTLRETDRRYIKFKMKRVKKAKRRGNNVEAERHATELIQYLGLDESSEAPVEEALGVTDQSINFEETDRLQRLRESASREN